MIRHSSSIEINATVSDVFTFVSTIENIPKWQTDVLTTKVTSSGTIRAGSQFQEVAKILGKPVETVCEITEYQPVKRFGFRSISQGPVSYSGQVLTEPNGRGTRVTVNVHVQLHGLWKIAEPLFALEIRGATKKELKTLKSLFDRPAN